MRCRGLRANEAEPADNASRSRSPSTGDRRPFRQTRSRSLSTRPKPITASSSSAPDFAGGRDRLIDARHLAVTRDRALHRHRRPRTRRRRDHRASDGGASPASASTTSSSRSTGRKFRSWTAAPPPSSTAIDAGRPRRPGAAPPLPQGAQAGPRRAAARPSPSFALRARLPPRRRDRFRQPAHRPPAQGRRPHRRHLPPRDLAGPHLRLHARRREALEAPASRSAPRSTTRSRSATTGVINPEGLRYADEFVRHKTLDAVGDLALAGVPLLGTYRSYCGGHRLNFAVLEALFADRANYAIVEAGTRRETRPCGTRRRHRRSGLRSRRSH